MDAPDRQSARDRNLAIRTSRIANRIKQIQDQSRAATGGDIA